MREYDTDTTKELYEMIAKNLCENERIYSDDDFKAIHLNGVLIFYTTYVIEYVDLDSDEFTIHFFDESGTSCIYRSSETDYIYFKYRMYEII